MKILFIRFSSIGDIVLTSPVVRCVKQQINSAEVHFLLKKSFASTVENNPFIDKVIFHEDDLVATIKLLKKEKYDVVIDLQKNFRSFRITRDLNVKHYSFDKLNFKKWLFVNLKLNILPKVHIVDRYFDSVKALNVVNDNTGLDYFISKENEKAIERLPVSHKIGYVGWVIGARHFTKRMPNEKMNSIGKKIKSPVVLLGGKEDFENAERLRNTNPDKYYNACGLFSLNESAAIVKNASVIVTHDTGLMHIAAAFNKRIISVWGNTVPDFGMYPYFGKNVSSKTRSQNDRTASDISTSQILEVTNLSCRPCSKIGFEKCPRSHFKCMHDIDETIFNNL